MNGEGLPLETEHIQYHSEDKRFNTLIEDMRIWSKNPTGEDEVEADFYTAALEKLTDGKLFHEILHGFVKSRPELNRSHLRYLTVRSFQKFASNSDFTYPTGYDSQRWSDVIQSTLMNSEERLELEKTLHTKHLQTNIADRYKSIPPIVSWMRNHDRIGQNLTLLDIGASANHGLKKLALMDIIPGVEFSKTRVVDAVNSSRSWGDTAFNESLTSATYIAQNRPISLAFGIGIDKEDMSSEESRKWARACLTPREYQNGEIFEYDLIDAINPKNIILKQQNFLDAAETEFLRTSPEDHGFFDVVTMVTVLNQLNDKDRHKLLNIARRYVKETGLIVVQDFARVNPDLRFEIDFLDSNWNEKFSYRTIILDAMEKDRGYQEAWLYDTGRCRTVQAGIGRIASAGSQVEVPFKDFLQLTA